MCTVANKTCCRYLCNFLSAYSLKSWHKRKIQIIDSYHALSKRGNVSKRVIRHSLDQATKFWRSSHSKNNRLVSCNVTDIVGNNLKLLLWDWRQRALKENRREKKIISDWSRIHLVYICMYFILLELWWSVSSTEAQPLNKLNSWSFCFK